MITRVGEGVILHRGKNAQRAEERQTRLGGGDKLNTKDLSRTLLNDIGRKGKEVWNTTLANELGGVTYVGNNLGYPWVPCLGVRE